VQYVAQNKGSGNARTTLGGRASQSA
jgi:hypothetical protein